MTVERLLDPSSGDRKPAAGQAVPLAVWLDWLEFERNTTIARLRNLDRVLIQFGRLRQETLERRVR